MNFIRLCALSVSDPDAMPTYEHLEADAKEVLRRAEMEYDRVVSNMFGSRYSEARDAIDSATMCLVNAHKDLVAQQSLETGAQLILELLGKRHAEVKGA